jgi:hypothetical protein
MWLAAMRGLKVDFDPVVLCIYIYETFVLHWILACPTINTREDEILRVIC